MLDLLKANLDLEKCPKCNRLCWAWKQAISHLFPKKYSPEDAAKRARRYYEKRLREKHRPCFKCANQREIGQSKYCKSCWSTEIKSGWKARHQAAKSRQRARLRGIGGSFSGAEFRALCEKYGNACLCCGVVGVDLTVDHVLPLSKGGRNEIENIQPLCHGCNVKKGAETVDYRPQAVAA